MHHPWSQDSPASAANSILRRVCAPFWGDEREGKGKVAPSTPILWTGPRRPLRHVGYSGCVGTFAREKEGTLSFGHTQQFPEKLCLPNRLHTYIAWETEANWSATHNRLATRVLHGRVVGWIQKYGRSKKPPNNLLLFQWGKHLERDITMLAFFDSWGWRPRLYMCACWTPFLPATG